MFCCALPVACHLIALTCNYYRQIFPTYMSDTRTIHKESVIAKIKERRQLQLQDRTQEENEGAVPESQGGSASST